MEEFKFKDESYAVIGAAMAVHRVLGCGFSERVYQEALAVELNMRDIPFEREKHLSVNYKGCELHCDFYADFVCFDKIIIELKAVANLLPEHQSQLINYLKCSGLQVGYLLNFASTSLEYKRIVY